MGSWNETCVLSRTPICASDKVRVLTVFSTLDGRGGYSGAATATPLGFPFLAQYDDYGGWETPAAGQVALIELVEKARDKNPFYRKVVTKRRHLGTHEYYVANSREAFFPAEMPLKVLYNHQLGIRLSDDEHAEPTRAKSAQAYAMAKGALDVLGELMKQPFPEGDAEFTQDVFDRVEAAFGPEKAWMAWHLLQKSLFIRPRLIFMHEASYQAVVQEWGGRVVTLSKRAGERMSIREFLNMQLTEFIAAYRKAAEEATRVLRGLADAGVSEEDLAWYRQGSNRLFVTDTARYLVPMGAPWLSSELPLLSHFWDAVSLDDILNAIAPDDMLDFLVFQWARHYIRFDFMPQASGSQNAEVVLLHKANKAAVDLLMKQNRYRTDFMNSVYA